MYQKAIDRFKEIQILGSISSLLHWDMEAIMPSGGAESRGEQIGLLAKFSHRALTDKEFIKSVDSIDDSTLSDEEKRQAYLLRKYVYRANTLEESFVEKLSTQEVKTHSDWKLAKEQKSFAKVKDSFERLLELKRDEARKLQESSNMKAFYSGKTIYEVMLDDYEPEYSASQIRSTLESLTQKTRAIFPKIKAAQEGWVVKSFPMDKEKQYQLGLEVSRSMGLDYTKTRLDTSTHPFCTSINRELRITTRYDEKDFTESLLGVVHEAGHGLYEQGLPEKWRNTPMGQAVSSGVHESQSRFFENIIGRSRSFCSYLANKLQMNEQEIFQALNAVRSSYIRTESDEVTYNLHIALRFKLEEQLVMGDLSIQNLIGAWNHEFESSFGLKIESDDQGVLQDIHWFSGAFGYFPTYSLGNLFAAELFELFTKKYPNWAEQIEKGDFSQAREFLNESVHSRASRQNSTHLIRNVLGRDLSEQAHMKYLEKKYLSSQ
ncbi:MAG: carboxypeptidase M32 [Oligoflexia bacterium]|nr:carboxypeptidase M32 [Oligoflexia bacterium]